MIIEENHPLYELFLYIFGGLSNLDKSKDATNQVKLFGQLISTLEGYRRVFISSSK